MSTCTFTCIHSYVYLYIYLLILQHIYLYIHYIHLCIYLLICQYIHLYIHVYIVFCPLRTVKMSCLLTEHLNSRTFI